jgi:hypothetical protein
MCLGLQKRGDVIERAAHLGAEVADVHGYPVLVDAGGA